MDFIAKAFLAFVPLLIAIDPAASVTVYIGLVEGLDVQARRAILRDAFATAVAISIGFMFLGQLVFRLLGIDKTDFQIGGGLILLVLSLADILTDRAARHRGQYVGVVPLGTPLIVGPAVLTALSLLQGEYGNVVTAAGLLSALALTAAAVAAAQWISRVIGHAGLKAVSKIISILLAGFAVHLIRMGVKEILGAAAG